MDHASRDVRLNRLAIDHGKAALNLAQRLIGPDQAEDLVQEAILRAVVGSTGDEAIHDPRAWLMGIVRHLASDRIRHIVRERRINAQLLRWESDGGPSHTADFEETVTRYELRELVLAAIARLSKGQREAVTGFYLDQLSVRDLALAMGTSVGAVKVRLHAARQQLRVALADLAQELGLNHFSPQERPMSIATLNPTIVQPPTGWIFVARPVNRLPTWSTPEPGTIRLACAAESSMGWLVQFIDAKPFHGRCIRVRGELRAVAGSNVGIQVRVLNRDRPHEVQTAPRQDVPKSSVWVPVEIVARVDACAEECMIGLVVNEGAVAEFRKLTCQVCDAPSTIDAQRHRSYRVDPCASNLAFSDGLDPEGIPKGWRLFGRPQTTVKLLDATSGGAAVRLVRDTPTSTCGLGNLMQMVSDLSAYRGRQVAMTFRTRCAAIGTEAWPWLRVDGRLYDSRLDNGASRRLAPDTDWHEVRLVADVRPGDRHLAFGVALQSAGSVEVGPVRIEATSGEAVTTRENADGDVAPPEAHAAPVNLSFTTSDPQE